MRERPGGKWREEGGEGSGSGWDRAATGRQFYTLLSIYTRYYCGADLHCL